MESEIDSNTWTVEVRMANSTTSKFRKRFRLRSVAVVIGGVCGGGTCAMRRVFRGRRGTKDQWLLGSEPEPEKRRRDIVSIVGSIAQSLSRQSVMTLLLFTITIIVILSLGSGPAKHIKERSLRLCGEEVREEGGRIDEEIGVKLIIVFVV